MPGDPQHYVHWKTTQGMFPAPCHLTGLIHRKTPSGSVTVDIVTVVGWGMDATPLILLSDGALGALGPHMKLTNVRPVQDG